MINSLQIKMDWKAEGFGFANSCWKYSNAQRCVHQSVQHTGFAGREHTVSGLLQKVWAGAAAKPFLLESCIWYFGHFNEVQFCKSKDYQESTGPICGRAWRSPSSSSSWAGSPTIFSTLWRSCLSDDHLCVFHIHCPYNNSAPTAYLAFEITLFSPPGITIALN